MAEHVKVLVDLSKGSVEVEAPVDSLKEIFAELSALLPKLDMHGKIATSNDVNPQPNTSDDEAATVKPKRPAKKSAKPFRENLPKRPAETWELGTTPILSPSIWGYPLKTHLQFVRSTRKRRQALLGKKR